MVLVGAPGKASMVPGGSPSPPSHPNHPTHPSQPTPAPFYLIDKSTGLYRAALLMSVLGASHRYFRLLMTPWWLIMHELYVVYLYILILIVFKEIQASKMQKRWREKGKHQIKQVHWCEKGGWKGTVRIALNGLKFCLEHFFNILSQILHLGGDL